ncbi:hypothetical protein MLD38_028402 [Melastoma candidum]|uniref:Uncharacterized protein n=1 Tax=Melastoma candidum TaxID=119954 RepID=A0ACB9N6W5_9MYRT|nr:hypothetical protein MLD38_028402 [Melastoma candidum]
MPSSSVEEPRRDDGSGEGTRVKIYKSPKGLQEEKAKTTSNLPYLLLLLLLLLHPSTLPLLHFKLAAIGLSVNLARERPSFQALPRKAAVPLRVSSSMATEVMEEKGQAFDSRKAEALVRDLRSRFEDGRTRSYEWRVFQLKAIARMVKEREKDILGALMTDLSKPELEAFVTEISLTKSACKKAISELKAWMKPEKVKTSIITFPSSAEIVSEPFGVVLIISTWNFPFLLSLDPLIGAISAGNAVVLKPSESAPATSSLLTKLLEEYVDGSAVRVVEGAVPETTALLEQRWDKILYTGSGRVARIVMAAAAKHLTPVILELGGKCPAIVDSNVDLEVAAKRLMGGKWTCNNGQACIAVDHIITPKSFAPKLIEALRAGVEEFFGKNPTESQDMSRVVNRYHFARLAKLMDEDGVSEKIVFGGERDEGKLRIAPTVLLDVPGDSQIMQEEIFGPLLPIVTVDKVEDGIALVNSRPKPLAAYLFTKNDLLKQQFVQRVSAGGMLINDTVLHLTVPGLPFGGVGESGMGSYHGKFSFDAFSHKKAVLSRGFVGEINTRYPPYTPKKQRLLKALIGGNIIGIILALIGWNTKE